MKYPFTLFFIFLFAQSGLAQIPVQVFGGHKALEYNFLWYKDVDARGKWSLFNFTFFTIDYQDKSQNTYEIYQVATYNFTKNWGLASGGRFSEGQFVPQLAISYQLESKDLYLNLFPSLQYFTDGQALAYSLFGLVFYRPPLNDTWKIFSQLAFEPLLDAQGQHIFSYQQIRLGLDYKGHFQFGLGANLEQLGAQFEWRQNYGLFIRKELN